MKKFLLAAFLLAAGVFVNAPTTSAMSMPQTDITGVVTNNGQPVSGARVTVVCNSFNKQDQTDETGTYLVTFEAKQCPAGEKATVVASKKNMGGTNSGTVDKITNKLNIAIVNVSVPEYGLITGIGATLIGAGVFLTARRQTAA
jgi:hypothetical protein